MSCFRRFSWLNAVAPFWLGGILAWASPVVFAQELVPPFQARVNLAEEEATPVRELPVSAPMKADEIPTAIQQRMDALTKRVAELESQQKKSSDTKAKDGAAKSKDSAAKTDKKDDKKSDKKDEGVDLSQEKWTVKLGGHVQLDYINWAHATPNIPNSQAQDYFEFRRLRLVADGTGYGLFDFRLQMTLEPETVGETQPLGTASSPDVKDAYFSINEIPGLGRFRIGNFFVPFSLEQVTNDTNNIFMERSIPTQGVFSPDREVGIAFYNATEEKRLTWSYGAFFDSISDTLKERIDDNQGYRLSGRLTFLPYYDEASNGRYLVHTGAGVLYTKDQDKRLRLRARPQIHEGPRVIDSGTINADDYTIGNVEAAVVWGSITFQGEAFLSQANLVNGGTSSANGAYVHVSYFLTGENRIFDRFGQHGAQFSRNQPIENFFMASNGFGSGAWELKGRWSRLDLNDINRGQYNDFTFGVNWYWTDRTRVMFDWIHPITSAPAVFGAANADILAMRFDWNW